MRNPYERLLVDLAEAGVQFVVVGGIACAFNGHVRATEGVDILVRRTDANLRLLLDALLGFGEGYARELTLEDFPDEEGAVRVVEDFPVDIFVRMSGQTYEDLEPHIQCAQVGREDVPFLGLEGLILLKEQSLREKDRMDVLALKALR